MAGIEFQAVEKRYAGAAPALCDVTVEIQEGSMVFLTGHSGAGKSTFLKLLLRLSTATSGRVLVGGADIGALPPRHLPRYRQRLGAVFQDHHLLPHRDVFENVALPLWVAGLRKREASQRVAAALAQVELLGKERVLPGRLSAGERQRVGIARAVVSRPSLLLADEPTGNLDPVLSRSVMGLFAKLNAWAGVTVVVASHDTALIAAMPGRVIELRQGRVLRDESGRPDQRTDDLLLSAAHRATAS